MTTEKLIALLSRAESFISGFEDDETQEGITELLQEIRDAIAAHEDSPPPAEPDCCAECGGVIGYDAYVDSNSDLVAGPFDHNVCMSCDRENPPVAGASTEEDDDE